MGDLNLNIRLHGMDGGVIRLFDRIRGKARQMDSEGAVMHVRSMSRVTNLVGQYKRLGGAIRSAVTAGLGLSGALLGAGLIGITRTAVEFDNLEAKLTGLEGSAAGARRSMAWIMDFAKTTPYEIGQVADAFTQLRAYGIDPTNGSLRVLGDTASMMGKDLMSAVEMIADAQSGEFERLKEFGIRTAQVGDRVTFSWVENGKTVQRSASKTGAEITRTLMDVLGPKNVGAMARQSQSLGGLWSGIKDSLTIFKKQIADAGLKAFLKTEMSGLLASLSTEEGRARASALAKEISGALVSGLRELKDAFKGINVRELIGGMVSIVTFLPKVIQFFGGLSKVITILGTLGIAKIGFDLGSVAVVLGGFAGIAAGPIVLIAAGITALAVGAFLIYRNWGKIGPWFHSVWNDVKNAFAVGVAAVWQALPVWFRMILRGAAFAVRIGTDALTGGGGRTASIPTSPPSSGQPAFRIARPALAGSLASQPVAVPTGAQRFEHRHRWEGNFIRTETVAVPAGRPSPARGPVRVR